MTTRHRSSRASAHSRRAILARAVTIAGGAVLSLGLLPACAPQPPAPKPAAPAPTSAPAAKPVEKPAEKPAAAAPAAKVAAEPKPRSGGKLTVVTEANWVDLEPHKNALFASTQAYDHVYEALTEYDQDLKAAPALAESWETPDPRTHIFKLRQGVTWHDGSPFTTEDVKYSIERVRAADTASPWRDSYGSVDKVEVVDPRTIKISHTRPNAFFLETLASLRGTAIIKNGSAEKLDLKREAVGTGPFKLAEIKNGDFVRFERNATYWGKPRPYADELTLKLMVEEDTRVAWLRAGQVDYIDLYAEGAQRLEGDASTAVVKAPKVYMMGISFFVKEKPLADGRVRKALDMAVDRQAAIEKARFGAAELTGFVPSGFGEWSLPENKLPAYYTKPDIEGAKKLLAEAGFPNGFEIEIKGSRPEHMAIAVVAKDSWKKIGVDAKVVQQEYGTYISDNSKGLFQALVIGNTFVPNPVDYIATKFHTKGSGNRYVYSNPKLDAAIEDAQRATDREQIKKLLEDTQRMLWDDGAPYIYLYNALNLEGLRSVVKGYTPSYTSRRTAMRDAFLGG